MTEIRSFYPYMRSFVHPTSRDRFYIHPSVRPEWFSGISRKTHERIWNGLQICMLLYPDNVQIWLDFGHSLFICLILVLFAKIVGLVYVLAICHRNIQQDRISWNGMITVSHTHGRQVRVNNKSQWYFNVYASQHCFIQRFGGDMRHHVYSNRH